MRQGKARHRCCPRWIGDCGWHGRDCGQGRLTLENHTDFLEKGQEVLAETPFLIVNLAQATFFDSSGAGGVGGVG